MAKFRYNGSDERYYPDQSIVIRPGDVAELDEAPDSNFEPADQSTPKTQVSLPDVEEQES